MISNYDEFHDQISHLLDLIDQEALDRPHRDALATAMRVARSSGNQIGHPHLDAPHGKAFTFGQRILDQLRDADKELSSDEVAKLDALVNDRLPILF